MSCYVAISKGQWLVHRHGVKKWRRFPLDGKALSAYLKRFRIRRVQCSSSVDFPKDSGVPKGWDVGRVVKVLDRALGWQFTPAELKRANKAEVQEQLRHWAAQLQADPCETPEHRVASLKAASAIAALIE